METVKMDIEFNNEFLPVFNSIFKQFKVKSRVIENEKDPTEMTKEEFFSMIDKARAGKKVEISREELRKMMFD